MVSTFVALKRHGLVKDTINAEDMWLKARGYNAIGVDDKLLDMLIENLEDNYCFGDVASMMDYVAELVKNKDMITLEDYPVDLGKMSQDIGKLMGTEQARQYVMLLVSRLHKSSNYDTIKDLKDYLKMMKNHQMFTLDDMLMLIFGLCIVMLSVEDFDSWIVGRRRSYTDSLQYRINDTTGLKGFTSEYFTPAGRLLDLNENLKKNIIGSLWNCIIDIIVDLNVNEEERSEQ